jgi:hypothetical protein
MYLVCKSTSDYLLYVDYNIWYTCLLEGSQGFMFHDLSFALKLGKEVAGLRIQFWTCVEK